MAARLLSPVVILGKVKQCYLRRHELFAIVLFGSFWRLEIIDRRIALEGKARLYHFVTSGVSAICKLVDAS